MDFELLAIDPDVARELPELSAIFLVMDGLRVRRADPELDGFMDEVCRRVAEEMTLDGLKDDCMARLYRDFFWRLGIDPTKIRPAAEVLTRRILQGKPLPRINTLVDAYNLASVTTGIPFGAFDADVLSGPLEMRRAREDEQFHGIGMKQPVTLKGKELVLLDGEHVAAVYPYRDADRSKVTLDTKRLLLMACGAPGVSRAELKKALAVAVGNVERFCK